MRRDRGGGGEMRAKMSPVRSHGGEPLVHAGPPAFPHGEPPLHSSVLSGVCGSSQLLFLRRQPVSAPPETTGAPRQPAPSLGRKRGRPETRSWGGGSRRRPRRTFAVTSPGRLVAFRLCRAGCAGVRGSPPLPTCSGYCVWPGSRPVPAARVAPLGGPSVMVPLLRTEGRTLNNC